MFPFSLGACATVVDGNSQNIAIASTPVEGANCTLTNSVGTYYALTPAPVHVSKSSHRLEVDCRKAGYRDATAHLNSNFDGWTVGNVLIGGLVGVAVDGMSGAMFKYPKTFRIAMTPSMAPIARATYRTIATSPILVPLAVSASGALPVPAKAAAPAPLPALTPIAAAPAPPITDTIIPGKTPFTYGYVPPPYDPKKIYILPGT